MTTLIDTSGSVFRYEFDGEGNRQSQALNDCLATRFVHDGPDVLLELNPANAVAYAWIDDPGVDQPIERLLYIDGAPRARRVFHSDAIGSIAALTDPDGLLTQSYSYSAFGSLRSSSGPDPNRITYTAREQLGDSQGWMYCRHRIYVPVIGRFITVDLIGFISGINQFEYAHNLPVNNTDPMGLADRKRPLNGRVKTKYHPQGKTIRSVDWEHQEVLTLQPGEETPADRDFDFVEIDGVWYKISIWNFDVSYDKDGNPIGDGGFDEVSEKDRQALLDLLKRKEGDCPP